MKTVGLIGGTSCESMAAYYRIINLRINKLLGGHHSAKLVIVNLDFNEIVPAFYENRWDDIEKIMVNAGRQLERAGVDFIAICCNTLHKVALNMSKIIQLPLLHILEPTGQEIKRHKISKVGLLGTKFTMSGNFHSDYLYKHFQIESVTPTDEEKEIIDKIIFSELCYGILRDEAKQILLEIIDSLRQKGAQGIVLGCTELFMLFPPTCDLKIPIFDTTELHANAIVDYALENNLDKLFIKDTAVAI